MTIGFCLASFYLIPAVYEQRWVQISGALSGGLRPADNFLYARTSDAEHDAFNRIASHIAVLLILWTVSAALAVWRSDSLRAKANVKVDFLKMFGALSSVAILLMFPVTGFAWRHLPELRFVQFPWRWMSILAVCGIIFTAGSARGWLRWAWLVLVSIIIVGSAHYLVKHAWWDTEDMPALQAAMRDGTGFEGTDEYDPIGDDHGALPQKQPRAVFVRSMEHPEIRENTNLVSENANVVIEEWKAEHRVLRVTTQSGGWVVVRLANYPPWRVTLNGKSIIAQHSKETAQMIVPVPAGESELRADFVRTLDC